MRAVCVAGLGLAGASGCLGDDPSAGGQSAAPINHAPTAGPGLSAVVAVNGTVTLDLLAGATDPDGDALFVAGVDVPASSAFASIGVDRRHVTFMPLAQWAGTFLATFRVSDGQRVGTGTAQIVVDHVPVARSTSVHTPHDVPVAIALAGTDDDLDALTYEIVRAPAHGTLTGTGAQRTYTPARGYGGPDELSFRIRDASFSSAVATVTISVDQAAPTAISQVVALDQDTTATIELTGVDPEGDPLTFALFAPAAHGSVSLSGSTATYTPFAGYSGSDRFTFVVSDGQAVSPVAAVSLTVRHINHAPVAIARSISATEDRADTFLLVASDPDLDPLRYAIAQPPAHGRLTGSLPSFTYQPDPDYNGPDAFTFTVSDGALTSAPATMTIAVAPVNDPPTAIDQVVTTAEDTPIDLTLRGTDIDSATLTFTPVTTPSDGQLLGGGARWTYTPAANANGVRSFRFQVSDGQLTAIGTVTITITPVNDAPTPIADYVATDRDVPLVIRPLRNDRDVDGDPLTLAAIGAPAHGTATIVDDTVVYTPAAGFAGDDLFAYTVADPAGATATGQIHVGVGAFPRGAPAEVVTALAEPSLIDPRQAPSVSADGRYLAFVSVRALVADDTNGLADVYVYDRGTRTVERVSESSTGGQAHGASSSPRITPDGRYVVFDSIAPDLVADDTNGVRDAFRHDRLTGETLRLSVSSAGQEGHGASTDPRISDDGTRVAFLSAAFDLVADDANGAIDVLVRDLAAGTTTRVNVSPLGGDADLGASDPAISGDGRFVAFASAATNLVVGDTNAVTDVFVRDLAGATTSRVSLASTGGQADRASIRPALSRDGRFVAFLSSASTLVAGADGTSQAYVRDRTALTTTRALTASSVSWAQLSADGRYLAVAATGGVVVRDRFAATTFVPTGAASWLWPALAADGSYVIALDAGVTGGALMAAAALP